MQKIIGLLSVAVLGLIYLLIEAVRSNKRLTTENIHLDIEIEDLHHKLYLMECEMADDREEDDD